MLHRFWQQFYKIPEYFNYVEVFLWPALGLLLAVYGLRRRGAVRRRCLVAAITLGVFGASDWFEADNGNEWWHPWWLLLWKAGCVVVLVLLTASAYLARRSARREREPAGPAAE